MRKIITTTFVSMDGVMQGVEDPDDTTEGEFTKPRWWADYNDELTGKIIDGFVGSLFELLLGRKTYDIFSAYWPFTEDAPSIGKPFNATKKHVVSHTKSELAWENSSIVTGDVVSEIKKLKEQDAPDLWVWGSSKLIQTLLNNDLVDEMHIWTHPLSVGGGKRLFKEGTQSAKFQLGDSQVSSNGVIIAHYVRTGQ